MPIIGFGLLWLAYTLEWYGWCTYEFSGSPVTFTDLILPSRANLVRGNLIQINSQTNTTSDVTTTGAPVTGPVQ